MKFKDSALAHKYLDHLCGVEIGGAAHNPFNLPNCLNVDYTADHTVFREGEKILCNENMIVDVVANGDDLPWEDNVVDYVISSHVIEHFFDPVKAIKEWLRVVKPYGFVFIIAPKARALPGENRPVTTVEEIIGRHEGTVKPEDVDMSNGHQVSTVSGKPMGEHGHWSVWDLKDFLPICTHYGWTVVECQETDDKVGNGFTVVLQK